MKLEIVLAYIENINGIAGFWLNNLVQFYQFFIVSI